MRKLKTFESFKVPTYRTYFIGMAGQWASQSMLMIVNTVLVYRLTGSTTSLGTVVLAQALPMVLVGIFGGAVADCAQKKYILFFSMLGLMIVSLGFAISLTFNILRPETWWLTIIASALLGSLLGFLQPATFSILPEIVSKGEVMNAISLSTMGHTFFRLIGPAIAGFLIDNYGFNTVYFLMTALYMLGCIFISRLPHTRPANFERANPLGDVVGGLRYIKQDSIIMAVVIFGLVHVITGMPYMQLMTVFTDDILKVGATGLGILTSISAAGAMIGSLILASLPNRKRGLLLLMSGVILGIAITFFTWSESWIISLAVMPLTGIGTTMHMTMTSTIIQYYAEPDYRGRMQSFVTMTIGLSGLGTFVAGILADFIGVQGAIGGMAILLLAFSIGCIMFLPRISRLE